MANSAMSIVARLTSSTMGKGHKAVFLSWPVVVIHARFSVWCRFGTKACCMGKLVAQLKWWMSLCRALHTSMGKHRAWHTLGRSLCRIMNKGTQKHSKKKENKKKKKKEEKKVEQIRDTRQKHIGGSHSFPSFEQKRLPKKKKKRMVQSLIWKWTSPDLPGSMGVSCRTRQ